MISFSLPVQYENQKQHGSIGSAAPQHHHHHRDPSLVSDTCSEVSTAPSSLQTIVRAPFNAAMAAAHHQQQQQQLQQQQLMVAPSSSPFRDSANSSTVSSSNSEQLVMMQQSRPSALPVSVGQSR